MLYKASYVDGSAELIEAGDIRKAKTAAQKLYDVAIKNVVVQNDVDTGDVDDEEEDDAEVDE